MNYLYKNITSSCLNACAGCINYRAGIISYNKLAYLLKLLYSLGFPGGSVVKNSPAKQFDPWSEISPGEGNGNPFQVFVPGKSHGQRNLGGYGPRGH